MSSSVSTSINPSSENDRASVEASTSSSSSQQQQQQRSSSKGIDIRQALYILSSRTPHHHGHDDSNIASSQEEGEAKSTSCCQTEGQELPSDSIMKTTGGGQVVDLFAPTAKEQQKQQKEQQQRLQTIGEEKQHQHKQQKQKAEENKAELHKYLHSSTTKISDLSRLLLKTQEDRVSTYHQYEQSLQDVLQTGNLTLYPSACARATAAFTVCSDTINAIKDELMNRDDDDKQPPPQQSSSNIKQYVQWIQNLQSLEKEKLQYTAAIHLEKIRVRNQQAELQSTIDGEGDATTNNNRVLGLLQQGVINLQNKIDQCVSDINIVLDDVRCALVEEMEEEEEEQEETEKE